MLSKRLYEELGKVIEEFPRLPLTELRYFRAMLTLQEQVMRASEPLLVLAGDTHPYLKKHQEEEAGHHDWIVRDLRALDVDNWEVPVNPLVAQMTGAQYFHLLHGKPMAFFGYLAFLEGYPAAPATIEALKAAFPRSIRTVEYHATHDIEHRAELVEVLDSLEMKYHDSIVSNAVECAELYKQALWRIIALEK